MGLGYEIISGRTTNAGATITALTPGTGDSFTVRNCPDSSRVFLEELWAQSATAGVLRVRSNRIHDDSQGIRLRTQPALALPLLPAEAAQPLYPQDLLIFEASGGGAETDAFFMANYYADLPGVDAMLRSWEQVEPNIVNLLGVECALTTGGTAGDWGGSQALNLTFDTFKRNVNYAILGYETDTAAGAIGIRGADTGNLRVGGPLPLRADLTGDWFVQQSKQSGRPHIPVINGANVPSTNIDIAATQTATAIKVVLLLAELKS